MKNLYNRIRQFKFINKLPEKSKINIALASFSKKERVIFSILILILVLSTLFILNTINRHFMVSMPIYGGSVSEGIVGTPRFINPVLAFSDVDQDLTTLVYSGLMRKDSDGNLIPDLAKEYAISNNGLTYTFILKDDVYFHDDTPVTVDDIIFTIDTVKNSIIKSPHKTNWAAVSVTKIDEKTIEFNLKQPYASFLANTTLGIMPADVWNDTPVELNTTNTEPIGSGPYKVTSVNKGSSGIVDSYQLTSFKKFALGRPYVDSIYLHFYPTEDDLVKALENGEVDQIGSISPVTAELLKNKGYRIESAVLPRVFGLFFNQSVNRLFVDKVIINAIDQAIDKDKIVSEVLSGYGVVIDEPIPPNMVQYSKLNQKDTPSRQEILQKVEKSLASAGWIKNSEGFLEKSTQEKSTLKKGGKTVTVNGKKTVTLLEFTISTSNAPELIKTAELIKQDLAVVGIKVNIQTLEVQDLNQDVIRPRKYDALLFGQIINNESDLFAFWHSSQRLDPGLNIAMYANTTVDKLLEDAFMTTDWEARTKKYIQFENEIKKDKPAVFLYSPNFIYVVSKNINGINMDHITFPSNRFLGAYLWYTEKYNVWKIFTNY